MREIMRKCKNRDIRLTNMKRDRNKGEGRNMDKSRVNSENEHMWLMERALGEAIQDQAKREHGRVQNSILYCSFH